MLVLSRKVKQVITAGDVKITVTAIKGSKVRIGIDAPKGVRVLRGELEGKQ